MRNLRTILGIKWQDHVPNTEVLNTTKSVDLWSHLQKSRVRWAGHMSRMDDSRIPKQVLYGKLPNCARRPGRPKLRFKDVVKRDLRSFAMDQSK